MLKLFLLFVITFTNFAQATVFYYPEEREYTSADRGYTQYGTPSVQGRSEYVLTYDDGPHITYTPQLLDILKKYNVKATFFIVTDRLNNSTLPILKRMLDEGHLIASHNHHHDNANQDSEGTFVKKVEESLKTLNSYASKAGHQLDYFIYRFPFAAYGTRNDYHHMNALRELSDKLFGNNCLQFAFWDIDSSDWVPGMTVQEIFQNLKSQEEGGTYTGFKTTRTNGQVNYVKVLSQITNPLMGGTILQHDIQKHTLKATELFLKYAKEKGIKIKQLTDTPEYAVRASCKFR